MRPASSAPRPAPPRTYVFEQDLPGDRVVLCIRADGLKSGGLDCDWNSTHLTNDEDAR